MILKIITCFLLILIQLLFASSASTKPSSKESPVLASESTEFFSKHQNPFLAMGMTTDFKGVIFRNKIKDNDLQQVNVYSFSQTQESEMSSKICTKIATRIFGPLDKISAAAQTPEIVPSKSKIKMCRMAFIDKDPQAMFIERHLYVRYIQSRYYGFVFKFGRVPTQTQIDDNTAFVETLKERR